MVARPNAHEHYHEFEVDRSPMGFKPMLNHPNDGITTLTVKTGEMDEADRRRVLEGKYTNLRLKIVWRD